MRRPAVAVVALAALAGGCGDDLEEELKRDFSTPRDPVVEVRCENTDGDYANCDVVHRSGLRRQCAVATSGDDGGACRP